MRRALVGHTPEEGGQEEVEEGEVAAAGVEEEGPVAQHLQQPPHVHLVHRTLCVGEGRGGI